jgi:hypothetical protein
MKAAFVLSIVVPVAFLTTLRFVGIMREPTSATEITTLDAVKWSCPRPNDSLDLGDQVGARYSGNGVSVDMRIFMMLYSESHTQDDDDYLRMLTVVNSTVTNPDGFIESVYVVFHKDLQPSFMGWIQNYLDFSNLSLVGLTSGWTSEQGFKEAYVRLAGDNHPIGVSFEGIAEWSLLTPNTQTHRIVATCEIIYYDGIVQRKIIQPFQLEILGTQ